MKQPKDIEARNDSIKPDKSCLLIAGAGSGKTEQLSRRMLTLLAKRERPEDILCITFTKKAASEMRHRVIKYLKIGTEVVPPTNPLLKETWELARKALSNNEIRGWDLLNNPWRLQITTIDAFCLEIANKNPLQNGYYQQISPVDDPEDTYRQCATTFIEQEHPTKLEISKCKFINHLGNSKEQAVVAIVELLAKRDQWGAFIEHANPIEQNNLNMNTLVGDGIKKLKSILNEQLWQKVVNTIEIMAKNNPEKMLEYRCKPYMSMSPACVRNFCYIIYSDSSSDFRKRYDKRMGLTTGDKLEKEQLASVIESVRKHRLLISRLQHLPNFSNSDNDQITLATIEVMKSCSEILTNMFQKEGKADFIGITDIAIKLTDKGSNASIPGDELYKDILIDEYQDTSTSHNALVKNLVKTWGKDTDKTLFLVGDPKQSLYLFRSAALGLFIDTQENGVLNVPIKNLELSVNFRSKKSIVDWVNKIFSDALPKENDSNMGAATYSTAFPFSESELDDSINFHITEDSGDSEVNAQMAAEALSKQILENLKKVPHETNAVLIRSRGLLKEIHDVFISQGITYKGIDLIKLSEKQPIIDLINLTKVLYKTNDNFAFLGVLRAPFVGVLQQDLDKILTYTDIHNCTVADSCSNYLEIQNLSQDAAHRIKKLNEALHSARGTTFRKPVTAVVQNLWLELKANHFTDDLQEEDFVGFFEYLSKFDIGKSISKWTSFEIGLQKLYMKPNPNATDKVQIMTIHKSKGLEFDNVYIIGMEKPGKTGSSQVLTWTEEFVNGKPIFVLTTKPGNNADKSLEFSFISHGNKTKEMYEMTRLLYVACTRAVKRLYMYATLKKEKECYKKPGDSSLLGIIYDYVEGSLGSNQCVEKPEDANESKFEDTPHKLRRYKLA